jgi:hypothetical protein
MGWWNAPENESIILGDAVLDIARRFLKELSQEYQEDLNRKPTVHELEYILNLAFRVNIDDDILGNFDEQEIKQVVLKLGKASKRQKSKPGDIFAFMLDNGKFGFGRVVSIVSIGAVIEIFDYISDQPIFDYSKLGKWLVEPLTINNYGLLDAKKDGDWRIIGHTADYVPGTEFKNIRFVYGTPPHSLTAVDIYDNEEPITVEFAKKFRTYDSNGDYDVKEILKEKIGTNNV